MGWNKVSEKEIPFGKEVIAFNKEWIDEDFNPNGTRIGFLLKEYATCKILLDLLKRW